MKMKKWLKCLLMAMSLMMAVNVGAVSTTIPAAAKAKKAVVKVGTKFESGKFQYKITSLKGKKGTATLVGTTSKKVTSVSVPKTVKKGKYTLTVDAIGDNAFKNCKKLEKVVMNTAIKKIGKNVLAGCPKLKTVNIQSKVLKSVSKNAMKGISKKAVVTVPTGKSASYKKLLNVAVQTPAAVPAQPKTQPETKAQPETQAQTEAKAQPETQAQTEAKAQPKTQAQTEAKAQPETKAQTEAPAKPTCSGKKHLGLVVVDSVAPTCTRTGLSSYEYCTVCGYETKPIVLSAVGHNLVHHAEIAPTCTSEGRTAYDTCTRCSYATPSTPIAKTAHAMIQIPGQDPTCTSGGWTTYQVCRTCGLSEGYEYLPKLGHNYDTWVTTQEPTCTEQGTQEASCTRCSAKTTRKTSAKGHDYSISEWLPVQDTCYLREEVKCSACGDEKPTYQIRHRDDGWESLPDIEPTCATFGKKNRTYCPKCKEERYQYVRPLGHNFCTPTIIEEATCQKEGHSYRKCVRCEARTAEKTIPKIAHSWVTKDEKATCTENGFRGKECSVCGEREGTVVKATGHKYLTTITTPTCETAGNTTQRCSVCGYEKTTQVEALGHNWVSYEEKKATCGEAGHSAYVQCKRCKEYQVGHELETYEALEHTWNEPVAIQSIASLAIPDEDCQMTSFVACRNCGTLKVVPGRGHVPGSGCWYERAKANGDESGFIQWTVFLSEKNWSKVPAGFESNCSRTTVWMNGKKYYALIPTRRSSVQFAAPTLEGQTGWRLANPDGTLSERFVPAGAAFDDAMAGQTYVAVF